MWSSNRTGFCLALGLLVATGQANAADVDLAALEVVPERGQSADQARRDRYECHNWAVDQTGGAPIASDAPIADEAKAERTGRILNGASIGAALGGLIRSVQGKNPSHGILGGAAVGAAVGATTARRDSDAAEDSAASDYLRALSACLEGRGYRVAMPELGTERVASSAR